MSIHAFVSADPSSSIQFISVTVPNDSPGASALYQSSHEPILRLVVDSPFWNVSACPFSASNFKTLGSGLASPNATEFELQIELDGRPIRIPALTLAVYGSVDSLGNSVIGALSIPACASLPASIGVGIGPTGIDLRNLKLTAKTDAFGTPHLTNWPGQEVALVLLPPNTLLQFHVSITKRVKVNGEISFSGQMQPAAITVPAIGYPTSGVLISVAPSVTLIDESRPGVLTLLGSISGMWASILFGAKIISIFIKYITKHKATESPYSHSHDDSSANSAELVSPQPTSIHGSQLTSSHVMNDKSI